MGNWTAEILHWRLEPWRVAAKSWPAQSRDQNHRKGSIMDKLNELIFTLDAICQLRVDLKASRDEKTRRDILARLLSLYASLDAVNALYELIERQNEKKAG